MKHYKFSALAKIVNRFKDRKILVLGDLLLDQFIWGQVSRISPEAPVPVVWVRNEGFMPGGACNVANNIAKLGAKVSVVGVVGDDINGKVLKQQLEERSINTDGVVIDPERPTILKTRVIAHHQQVVRIDRENVDVISHKYMEKVYDYIKRNIDRYDGVIIEDYGKGLITPSLLKKVVPLAKKSGKIVTVDPKESHFAYYKGVDAITPNHHEAAKAVGFSVSDENTKMKAGARMLEKLKAKVILLTLGEEGMMVFEQGRKPHRIPTVAQEVFDVSGAGDTVIGVYTLGVVSGGSPEIAAHIANCAAGIVVGKIGVAVVSEEELLSRLKLEIERVRV
ncbi:MAG: D-glycero-beta-D-manno-heptose-7-phosphate kinase [Candidatus Omnitrophica bacterium]|nr:D-glycero-beta-D-manno-heptose-7-phosphate kinase [Candidatus Omnitrophota bacterium]MDD5487610.1 D-glycero-beta-D-manno-heptose-7-phosphate kinase [Candidatus Omnitrophota bacterium]